MKQSINKFFVGFLFVLAIILIPTSFSSANIQVDPGTDSGGGSAVDPTCIGADCWGATVTHFGLTQIENTRTDNVIYIFNMSKKVYEPGEPVVVLTDVLFPTCGNATLNVILEGQISGQPNHYTIINENIMGGYAIYGAGIFTPPFQAPSAIGNYLMNVKAYLKKNGWYYTGSAVSGYGSQTPVIAMEQDLPFSIISSCGTLDGYTKCANEGETCAFTGTKNVAYGQPGSRCMFQDGTDGLLCNNTTFGFDPIPDTAKSCYYKPDVVTLVPKVTVFVDDQENPAPVKKGTEVGVRWEGENVISCKEDGGRGGNGVTGSFRTVIREKTTFGVTCDDGKGGVVTNNPPSNSPQYYKLQRCTDLSMVFETGPLPAGTYNTGDRLIGAVEGESTYNYLVTDFSVNQIPGAIHNIQTSNPHISGCPK